MENTIWLICEDCSQGFAVDLDTAKELWDMEEQGVDITCGSCDALQKDTAAHNTASSLFPQN